MKGLKLTKISMKKKLSLQNFIKIVGIQKVKKDLPCKKL